MKNYKKPYRLIICGGGGRARTKAADLRSAPLGVRGFKSHPPHQGPAAFFLTIGCIKLSMEKEVKLRINHQEFLDILKSKGFSFKVVTEISQEDLYFDDDQCNLLLTDKVLRVRKEGNTVKLTYKGPRVEVGPQKVREEIEGIIGSEECSKILSKLGIDEECPSDENSLMRILSRNGLSARVLVKKERTLIKLDGMNLRVFLDRVYGLGEFVELEGDNPIDLVRHLGLTCKIVVPTYAHLIHVLQE